MCHGMLDSWRHSEGLQGDMEQISNGECICNDLLVWYGGS